MCGICGKVYFDPSCQVSSELIYEMASVIAHRGPNDEGFYIRGQVGLGHRRLSIIDVSGGGQPISNHDDSVWIIFNGEIYNHLEVRAKLEPKGYRYKTRSDTETILHAYEEYGVDCVKYLNGMFAFAIWDERDKSLYLARDRFGIKPLYYRADANGLSFASEVKALLIDDDCGDALNPRGISDYFTSFVFGEHTMFAEIQRLLPARWLQVKNGQVRSERYWQPAIDETIRQRGEAENLEQLNALFTEVVRDHMMSEVPQGTFLSGGVDSSLITIAMKDMVDRPIKTYSIAFEGHRELDESHYAQQVAQVCKTDHHIFQCTPDRISLLPKVLWHLEEPLNDAPTIALMMLCQEASKEVTVVHCGDGGDEGFAGYTRFYWDMYADRYTKIPAAVRNRVLMPMYRLLQQLPGEFRNVGRRAEKFTTFAGLPVARRYMTWFSNIPDIVKEKLLTEDFRRQLGGYESAETFETLFAEARALGFDDLDVKQYHDLYNFVSHSLMLKGDKIAMSAGIEGRFPWLDHRLVTFGLSLPPRQKMSLTQLKLPLRRLLARTMPADFVWRRKRGFGVPIEDWFRGRLKESLDEAVNDNSLRDDGILNVEYVRQLVRELHAGNPHVWPYLWGVYVFQQWRKVFSQPKRVCRERALARAANGANVTRG